MSFKNVKRSAMILAVSASFILPHAPNMVWAKEGSISFPLDIFAQTEDDTGLTPTNPTIPSTGNSNGNPKRNNNSRSNSVTPVSVAAMSTGPNSMSVAKVPDAYSCPLFDNRPHAELINAIDSLSREVKASPECTGSPSAKALEENGTALKQNISALQKMIDMQDPTQVATAQIDQSMVAALQAVGNLGEIVNNNTFLNSKCGRQTMSTGKVLLALNDVINGLAPYALFAVSMNAALAPALPFVIGGAVATSGISAISKMIDQNTLDMTNPEHRKAVLQNTCQYTKVAKKVRFMQLAQSGKIDKITQELERNVDLYKSKFSKPTQELNSLLAYRATVTQNTSIIEKQLTADKADLAAVEAQIAQNSDDLLVCTLTNELVNWAQDDEAFPASVFTNLEAATSQGDRTQKLQTLTLKTLHKNSMAKIADLAQSTNDSGLKRCAQAGRSWVAGIRQAVNMTNTIVANTKLSLENELSQSAEYRQWKAQYNRIQTEKITIKRVEKAMQELAKDNSIIDRSELAQRMVGLKAGLFGSRSAWGFGKPPVLAWIDHTKTMHDQAISGFVVGMKTLRLGSFSLTKAGRGGAVKITSSGTPYTDAKVQVDSTKVSQTLSNLNLKVLPMGTREHELVCQQLESAWLDWSASIDHLGAIQFFCDMIDPVLDVKMDTAVLSACRGNTQLNGVTYRMSIVDQAKNILVKKGYQSDAALVSARLKELQCPMPAVSVMNQ